MATVNSYQAGKARAREKAIFWQNAFSNGSFDWFSIVSWCSYFEKLAKRFGLVREFKENGII